MATGATSNYDLPYPKSTDKVRVAGDIEQLATKIDDILLESIEDASAAMWTGGTFSNGLNTPTYNDTTGKMSMSLSQDLRTSASPTFSALTVTNNASVNGGILSTSATSASLFNNNATSLSIGESATTVSVGASTGTFTVNNANAVVVGDLAVDGGDLTSSVTTFNLLNATVTTLNIGGAATTVSLGAGAAGTFTINNASVVVSGDLAVNGGDITTNQSTFNIVTSATDVNIGNASGSVVIPGDLNLGSGKTYKINGTTVLESTSLGSGVVSSSLTSVGTIGTGVWNGSVITEVYGGTGQSAYVIGDILYASGVSGLAKLAIGTNDYVLTSNGTAPIWTQNTGTGNVVRATSPVLTTPSLGTASADYLTVLASGVSNEGGEILLKGEGANADVTIDNFSADLRIVSGSTRMMTIDTTDSYISARNILFNANETGAASQNVLIGIERGSDPNVYIRWNEVTNAWQFTNDGTNYSDFGSGTGGGGGSFEMSFLLGGM